MAYEDTLEKKLECPHVRRCGEALFYSHLWKEDDIDAAPIDIIDGQPQCKYHQNCEVAKAVAGNEVYCWAREYIKEINESLPPPPNGKTKSKIVIRGARK